MNTKSNATSKIWLLECTDSETSSILLENILNLQRISPHLIASF